MTSSAIHPPPATVADSLVDFDWQDADLVPQLLRHPGVSVRLFARARIADPGVKTRRSCGLPRNVDLADLTARSSTGGRQRASPRRTQSRDSSWRSARPACRRGRSRGGPIEAEITPAVEARSSSMPPPSRRHRARGLRRPSSSRHCPTSARRPTAPSRFAPRAGTRCVSRTSTTSEPRDRQGLETALQGLVHDTGAGNAELYLSANDHLELVVQVGKSDPLLKGLIELALLLGTPQVVSSISGPHEGKSWGAWPFKTAQRKGVLAAAAIHPAAGWTAWQRTVEELRTTWDEQDRERAGAAFPMIPETKSGWLAIDDFRIRLELAEDRNRRDGLRFSLHRLIFPAASKALERLAERLPAQLRYTDCICGPSTRIVLLLTGGPRDNFAHLLKRLLKLWEDVWRRGRQRAPVHGITDEAHRHASPDEAESFMTAPPPGSPPTDVR